MEVVSCNLLRHEFLGLRAVILATPALPFNSCRFRVECWL
jgi:hypothetical protein